jgi:hypothetical protein
MVTSIHHVRDILGISSSRHILPAQCTVACYSGAKEESYYEAVTLVAGNPTRLSISCAMRFARSNSTLSNFRVVSEALYVQFIEG